MQAGTEAHPQQPPKGLTLPYSINTEGTNETNGWTQATAPGEAQRGGAGGYGQHSVLHSRSSPCHSLGSCTFPKVTRLPVPKDKTLRRGHRGPRFISLSVQNHQARLSCNPLLGRAWCPSSHPFLCHSTRGTLLITWSTCLSICSSALNWSDHQISSISQFRTFDLFTVLWGQTVWPNTSLLTVSVKESLVSQYCISEKGDKTESPRDLLNQPTPRPTDHLDKSMPFRAMQNTPTPHPSWTTQHTPQEQTQ